MSDDWTTQFEGKCVKDTEGDYLQYGVGPYIVRCPECGYEYNLNEDDLDYGGNMCPRCLHPLGD